MKIALFGGSFDPIHNDHLHIIDYCYYKLHFDQVWIIPTYINPEKTTFVMSKTDTLALLKLVQRNRPFLYINQLEIDSQQICYTINTVKQLCAQHPENQFSFVGGDDLLTTIEHWEGFAELLDLCRFIIFQRNQREIDYFINKYQFRFILFPHSHFAATDLRQGNG